MDALIADMQREDCTLMHSFALYEEGMRLLASAQQQIGTVEQKLRILNEEAFGSSDPNEEA